MSTCSISQPHHLGEPWVPNLVSTDPKKGHPQPPQSPSQFATWAVQLGGKHKKTYGGWASRVSHIRICYDFAEMLLMSYVHVFWCCCFLASPFSWSEKQLKPKPCESVNGQVTSPLGHGQGLPRTSSPRCQRLRLRATKRNGGLELSWRAYPPVNVYIANWKITQLKDCHVQ
jgi:hypothetical protein